MNGLIHLLPVGFAMACWYLAYRVNRVHRWFRVGELVFWDVVLLIVVFLFWLIWF
jgi:hypothetical protein